MHERLEKPSSRDNWESNHVTIDGSSFLVDKSWLDTVTLNLKSTISAHKARLKRNAEQELKEKERESSLKELHSWKQVKNHTDGNPLPSAYLLQELDQVFRRVRQVID